MARRKGKATRKPTTKHVNVELRWEGGEWMLFDNRHIVRAFGKRSKKRSITMSRAYCRQQEKIGRKCEVVFKNMDGTIGKGDSAKASYGCESKRRRG